MSNTYYLPSNLKQNTRAMIFIDGENLAIRFGKLLEDNALPEHVVFEQNVFVWSSFANIKHHRYCEVIRKYCYTCVQGDSVKLLEAEEIIKGAGIEAPRVFKKKKGKRSKRVDITLATDMLMHAYRDNYDVAILVAGDEDYVPLVEAVMAEGKRVVLWFFEAGLSSALKMKVDHYFNIGIFLLRDKQYLDRRYNQ